MIEFPATGPDVVSGMKTRLVSLSCRFGYNMLFSLVSSLFSDVQTLTNLILLLSILLPSEIQVIFTALSSTTFVPGRLSCSNFSLVTFGIAYTYLILLLLGQDKNFSAA